MRRVAPRTAAVAVAVAVVLVLVLAGAAPVAAATKKPVRISGTVNVKGTDDVTGDPAATLDVTLDNFFISPTFTKADRGQTITVKVKNSGTTTHTFTSKALDVDETFSPGDSKTVELTVPDAKGAYRVFCSIHRSSGMQGAIYTKAKAKVTDAAPKAATGS